MVSVPIKSVADVYVHVVRWMDALSSRKEGCFAGSNNLKMQPQLPNSTMTALAIAPLPCCRLYFVTYTAPHLDSAACVNQY
jgi:hypothetical protein